MMLEKNRLYKFVRVLQFGLSLYMFLLITLTAVDALDAGSTWAKIFDSTFKTRMLFALLFIFPYRKLKRIPLMIYAALLFTSVTYYILPMAFIFDKPEYFTAITISVIVYIHLYFIVRYMVLRSKTANK